MKKLTRKLTALLLAVIMAATLCCMVLAEAGNPYGDYPVYLCLGDSIAAGYGPYGGDMDRCEGWRRVDVAYHAIVADALNAELIPLGHGGYRAVELSWMLEDNYPETDPWLFKITYTDPNENRAAKPRYLEAVKRADLITLNIGCNDILTPAMFDFRKAQRLGYDGKCLNELKAVLEGSRLSLPLLRRSVEKAQSTADSIYPMTTLTESIITNLINFTKNFDRLIGDIYALNPDVTLVVIGMYNPMSKLVMNSNKPDMDLGFVLDILAKLANRHMESGSAYADTYMYVDVMGTQVYDAPAFDDPDFLEKFTPCTHPTPAGHQFMAKQILDVLAANEAAKQG